MPDITHRQKRKQEVAAARALLAARFPAVIAPKGAPKKPLKVGIYQDLRRAASDVRPKVLHLTLHLYTSGPHYLSAMVEGATRFDLDGKPAGFVGKPAADKAQAELAVIRQKQAEQRARFAAKQAAAQAEREAA